MNFILVDLNFNADIENPHIYIMKGFVNYNDFTYKVEGTQHKPTKKVKITSISPLPEDPKKITSIERMLTKIKFNV